MTEPTRLETEDLRVDDDLEVIDGLDPLTDGGGQADDSVTEPPGPANSESADGKGPDVEVPTTPDPSPAEVQAKTGDVPDLSVPKPPAAAPPRPAMTVEQAREAYTAMSDEYNIMREERDALDVEMTAIDKKMQVYRPYMLERIDPKENQRGIIRYIKTQNEIRKSKAIKINEVLQGLKLHDVLPGKGSKLDQSMARKRARGLQRPQYPSKTV